MSRVLVVCFDTKERILLWIPLYVWPLYPIMRTDQFYPLSMLWGVGEEAMSANYYHFLTGELIVLQA